jgi:hypothetical protein
MKSKSFKVKADDGNSTIDIIIRVKDKRGTFTRSEIRSVAKNVTREVAKSLFHQPMTDFGAENIRVSEL